MTKKAAPEGPPFPDRAPFQVGRRAGLSLRNILAGGLIDGFQRQLDLAAVVDADQLDLDLIADVDDVGGLFDMLCIVATVML